MIEIRKDEASEASEASGEILQDRLTTMPQDPFSLIPRRLTNIKDLVHLFFASTTANRKVGKYLTSGNLVVEFKKGEVCYVVGGIIIVNRGGIPVQNYTKASIKSCQSWLNDCIYEKSWGLSVQMIQSKLPFAIGGVDPHQYELCLMRPGIKIEYGKIYIESVGNNENSQRSLKCTIPSDPNSGGSRAPEVDGRIKIRNRYITGGYVPNGTWLIITTDDLPLLKGKLTPALDLERLKPLLPEIMSFLGVRGLVDVRTLRVFRTKNEAEAYANTEVKSNNLGSGCVPLISKCIVNQDLKLGIECVLDLTDAEVKTLWHRHFPSAGYLPDQLPEPKGILLRVATVKPHNITFTDNAYPLGYEGQVIEDERAQKCVIS